MVENRTHAPAQRQLLPENTDGSDLVLRSVSVPISIGELVDKITILEIKGHRIRDERKRLNILIELSALNEVLSPIKATISDFDAMKQELYTINETLWDIEDRIRACEQRKDFGEAFIQLARNVYITNDKRARLKRRINDIAHSAITEEKSYHEYD